MGAVHQNRDLCLCVGIRAGWNRSARQNSGAIVPPAAARMPVAAFTEASKALYRATARPTQFNGSTQRDVQVRGIPESVRYPNFGGNVLLAWAGRWRVDVAPLDMFDKKRTPSVLHAGRCRVVRPRRAAERLHLSVINSAGSVLIATAPEFLHVSMYAAAVLHPSRTSDQLLSRCASQGGASSLDSAPPCVGGAFFVSIFSRKEAEQASRADDGPRPRNPLVNHMNAWQSPAAELPKATATRAMPLAAISSRSACARRTCASSRCSAAHP